MEAHEYQHEAKRTERINWDNEHGSDIAILGAIGEVGTLASVIKKHQRDGESYASFNDNFIEELGDIKGKRILHLQCHFGMDTLSLARQGAEVVGVDISDASIATNEYTENMKGASHAN